MVHIHYICIYRAHMCSSVCNRKSTLPLQISFGSNALEKDSSWAMSARYVFAYSFCWCLVG